MRAVRLCDVPGGGTGLYPAAPTHRLQGTAWFPVTDLGSGRRRSPGPLGVLLRPPPHDLLGSTLAHSRRVRPRTRPLPAGDPNCVPASQPRGAQQLWFLAPLLPPSAGWQLGGRAGNCHLERRRLSYDGQPVPEGEPLWPRVP